MRLPSEYVAERLAFYAFNVASFPPGVASDIWQTQYLRCYLADLGAGSIIEEPHYFDRDYLAEFTAFYGTSARGYVNNCRRVHAFRLSLRELRRVFASALAGVAGSREYLEKSYLGFIVIRPTTPTPFGRTVLCWYPEQSSSLPRITEPSRRYAVHVAGVELHVDGLAWQQQDTAVGACATVALWAMFHSSALDEQHSIPTTADVTRAANRRWPLATRVFPANDGLNIHQICEAIRAQGLQPAILDGDGTIDIDGAPAPTFSQVRFNSSCAALVRSGYPVLVEVLSIPQESIRKGVFDGSEGHAVCLVGFRSPTHSSQLVAAGEALEDDSAILHVYIHDDNLGPSVRFRVETTSIADNDGGLHKFATLWPDAPPPQGGFTSSNNPTASYHVLVPQTLVAAVPEEIRLSIDRLHLLALELAAAIAKWLATQVSSSLPGVTFSARFFRLRDYLGKELGHRLSGRRLLKARTALMNSVRPMSLHVGVVRLAIGGTPLLDVLYDTTDSERATLAFANVAFQSIVTALSKALQLGFCVRAF